MVITLHDQCCALGISFEVICIDDASSQRCKDQLMELQHKDSVKIELLNQNIGRSKIRNLLVKMSSFETLLFLDADGMVEDGDFISAYWEVKDTADIICGGRSYSAQPPKDGDLLLHWYYGTKREVSSAAHRQKYPWQGFQTNNFLVNKRVFEKVNFEESIKTYGHEDTLFGIECKRAGFTIAHIDNPAMHVGLETREQFISKMKEAVKNLYQLRSKGFPIETRLSIKSEAVGQMFICPVIYFLLKSCRCIFSANNRLKKPFLTLIDIQKMYIYLTYLRTDELKRK